jgi:SNF2 family DNA or RNA helicase
MKCITRALQYLVQQSSDDSARDKQGLNQFDHAFLLPIAERVGRGETLSATQAAVLVERVFPRYQRQLAPLGLTHAQFAQELRQQPVVGALNQLAQPLVAYERKNKRLIVEAFNEAECAVASAQFDPAFVQHMKALPPGTYRWSSERKRWIVDRRQCRTLGNLLTRLGYDIAHLERMQLDPSIIERLPKALLQRLQQHYPNLYGYQRIGVAWLEQPLVDLGVRGLILADDMGLGKTRQTLTAIYDEMQSGLDDKGHAVIVVPASLKQNWVEEIAMVDPMASVQVCGMREPKTWHDKAKRKGWKVFVHWAKKPADMKANYRWIIINYNILQDYFELFSKMPVSWLVADEGQNLRGAKSIRSRVFLQMCGVTVRERVKDVQGRTRILKHVGREDKPRRVFILTGTPVMNRLMDLYNLLRAIDHPLGRMSRSRFRDRYMAQEVDKFGTMRWVTNLNALPELLHMIRSVVLQRLKTDELEGFPSKTRRFVDVLSDNMNEYNNLEAMLNKRLAETGGYNPADKLTIDLISRLRHEIGLMKVPYTIEIVQDMLDSGEKVLLASNYRDVIKRFEEHFGKRLEKRFVTIHGGVPVEKRQALVDQFQDDPDTDLMILQIDAAGTGINATAATQVATNDLHWLPPAHVQVEDRAWRIGQTKHVQATYVIASDTYDERVAALYEDKLDTGAALQNMFKQEADVARQVLQNLPVAA